MKKKTLLIVIALLVVPVPQLVLQLRTALCDPHYSVSPIDNSDRFIFRAYSDTAEGGASVCSLSIAQDTLLFSFMLRQGYSKPFAGIAVEPVPAVSTINLSDFDSLIFTVRKSCLDTQDIKINLHTPFKRNTRVKPLHTRINEKIEPCLYMTSTVRVALKDFTPPEWWCEKCKVPCSSLRREAYNRVMALILQNGDTTPRNQKITFAVWDISFRKNTTGRVRKALLAVLIYYLCCGGGVIGWLIAKHLKKKSSSGSTSEKLVVSYMPLEVSNTLDEDAQRVVDYFGKRFNHAEMTLDSAAREIGMNQKKLSQTLNRTFRRTFKQYLNGLRIEEAKRLLRETDRQIAEIARKVGYQTVAHFNRTFRQMEECSPNEYRSKKS